MTREENSAEDEGKEKGKKKSWQKDKKGYNIHCEASGATARVERCELVK